MTIPAVPAPAEAVAAIIEKPAAPADVKEAPPAEEPTISPKLAYIAREEKRIEAEKARVAKERAEFESTQKSIKERETAWETRKANILADPISALETLGITGKDAVLMAEAIMYTQMPDKAPKDLRIRMEEAQARKDREARQKAEEEARAASERESGIKVLRGFAVTPEETPSVVAWFDDDKEALEESLMHTAKNMAESGATDLTPKAVAAELEAALDKRFSRRQQKPNTSAPQDTKAPPAEAAKQSVMSVKDTSARPPTPKATSEAERIKRAADVLANFQGFGK
jgi:hypothetical protein